MLPVASLAAASVCRYPCYGRIHRVFWSSRLFAIRRGCVKAVHGAPMKGIGALGGPLTTGKGQLETVTLTMLLNKQMLGI